MKRIFLIILICILIVLHWYSSRTERMLPKAIKEKKQNDTIKKIVSKKDFDLSRIQKLGCFVIPSNF